MTQYLVTTFKDSTGRKHTHITKAKVIKGLQLLRQRVKKKRKRNYEKQVKRDAVIKVGQLFENIRSVRK